MSELFLLHPATDVVDTLRGEPDGMEVIDHQRRCGHHVADRGGVATEASIAATWI
jgi:hypothetical protein